MVLWSWIILSGMKTGIAMDIFLRSLKMDMPNWFELNDINIIWYNDIIWWLTLVNNWLCGEYDGFYDGSYTCSGWWWMVAMNLAFSH